MEGWAFRMDIFSFSFMVRYQFQLLGVKFEYKYLPLTLSIRRHTLHTEHRKRMTLPLTREPYSLLLLNRQLLQLGIEDILSETYISSYLASA
jgi:hypothetical protein